MKKAMFLFVFCLAALWLAAQSPEWLWAKQAGGTGWDEGRDIATDSNGNSYVTGLFSGTATFGSTTLTSNGDSDIFITKLDNSGNYLWVKQAGGVDREKGASIAIDSCGNCYVTGSFRGPATFGGITLTSNGYTAMFIAKLDTYGNWLWAKQADETNGDEGYNITTDSNENCYVTGVFSGTATFGSTTLISSGWKDVFVAKLDTNGSWLWVKQAGSEESDYGHGIATDCNGNGYVTGWCHGTASFGSTTLSNSEGGIFIAKLDTNGNWLWVKQAGGSEGDYAYSITTDSSGNIYVIGGFAGVAPFGNNTLTSSGGIDIFIAKLDIQGNWLWVSKAGGTSGDYGYDIATDSSGNSYLTGIFEGTASFGNTTLASSGGIDVFIAKLDAKGNWLWTTPAEGTGEDYGYGIAFDSSGNIYVTGMFYGFATFGKTLITSFSDYETDIFIAKLSSTTDVSDEYGVPQANFSLGQNHPNPFTASTSFSLEVSDAKSVYEVAIYDLRGRHICTLHQGVLPKGERIFTWNGKDAAENQLASGVYFYRVTSGTASQVKKMIYVR
ncbi:MAG: SBBP repeat-containing protein [Candidatus Cloacimonetes bacterium]|nr:SBBP repeat-containing protein [Candidatus Cloacimonadota bacterium]